MQIGDCPFLQPTSFTSRKPCSTRLTQIVWAATSLPNLYTDTVVEKDTSPYILVKFHFTILGPPPPLFLIAKSFWDLCKIVDDTDGTHELSQCDFYILIQALG